MFRFSASAPKTYENLDGKSFRARYQQAPKAVLLDVRTAGEFAAGSIAGALNLDVTSAAFRQALEALDKDTEYFVFCVSGNRSGTACALMADKGLKACNLAAGISSWPAR